MGLTGHILTVELQLQSIPSPLITVDEQALPDLDALLVALREASRRSPFTVAWVDALATGRALGRGAVIAGRWAERSELRGRRPRPPRPRRLPCALPSWMLARPQVTAFDTLYYHAHRLRPRRKLCHPQSFFGSPHVLRGESGS